MNCTRTVQNVTKITFFEVTTSEAPDLVWFLSAAESACCFLFTASQSPRPNPKPKAVPTPKSKDQLGLGLTLYKNWIDNIWKHFQSEKPWFEDIKLFMMDK